MTLYGVRKTTLGNHYCRKDRAMQGGRKSSSLAVEDLAAGRLSAAYADSRLTSLLNRLAPSWYRNANWLRSNLSKNSSQEMGARESSGPSGKSIRSTPESLTRAGRPPRTSTHRRICSWSVVIFAARPEPARGVRRSNGAGVCCFSAPAHPADLPWLRDRDPALCGFLGGRAAMKSTSPLYAAEQ